MTQASLTISSNANTWRLRVSSNNKCFVPFKSDFDSLKIRSGMCRTYSEHPSVLVLSILTKEALLVYIIYSQENICRGFA